MSDIEAPSPFVVEWMNRVAALVPNPKRALDIAMGRGRHALVLARAGLAVFGVDSRLDALQDCRTRAASQNMAVRAWCADLTMHPLPPEWFQLILVTRYLQRDLFESIRHALVPGGIVMYETFTELQRERGRGPTSADHLLRPGELAQMFRGYDVMFSGEITRPDALARLVARKPVLSGGDAPRG
jgi:SAM-dependent methyltransferase